MKSQIRNPKSERSLNAETRGGYSAGSCRDAELVLRPAGMGLHSALAFTLIELLIVISIISILAAMVIPISGAVSRSKIRAKARVELERVATAIDLYKAKLGHFPPDNIGNPGFNQLYFELLGTSIANGVYTTLDGSAQVRADQNDPYGLRFFGLNPNGTLRVGGIINNTQGSGGDEGRVASAFLSGLKPDESFAVSTNNGNNLRILVAGVPAPRGLLNTISYVSSNPTNNPNSYDLWVDIVISGKTNRLNNWSREAILLQ